MSVINVYVYARGSDQLLVLFFSSGAGFDPPVEGWVVWSGMVWCVYGMVWYGVVWCKLLVV